MSPTGDLLVTSIFVGGSALLSLLGDLHMLYWHGTLLGAAYPLGYHISASVTANKAAVLDYTAKSNAVASHAAWHHSVHFMTHQSFAFY